MKSYDYRAVVCDCDVFCVECAPRDNCYPVFADSEWDVAPVCATCGQVHDYVQVIEN